METAFPLLMVILQEPSLLDCPQNPQGKITETLKRNLEQEFGIKKREGCVLILHWVCFRQLLSIFEECDHRHDFGGQVL